MSFGDWPDKTIKEIQTGLLLLGWRAEMRLTDDDAGQIEKVAREALELRKLKQLTPENIDRLAIAAHDIMEFQVMNVDERALMVTGPYSESTYFAPSVSLIDEATLCYYRGYDTAALGTLFIVLESYLLLLYGWTPAAARPSFAALKGSTQNLPPGVIRSEAAQILDRIYSFYNSNSPPQFYFNRHGLLHGLRGPRNVDRMNCVRMFLLFDILCYAEGLSRSVIIDENFQRRHQIYSACTRLGAERKMLNRI
jgi:hypothetical protein